MTESSKPRVAGLLLAAGGSSRLGRPKQLVEFEGKTLIRRSAESLIGAGCYPVLVVLGSETERSKKELNSLELNTVENQDWESGMSSSIRVGLDRLLTGEPSLDGVLITLCDQPRVTADKLKPFLEKFAAEHASIVAAEYDGVIGVPALFARDMFDALLNLTGDKGARELIRQHEHAASIDLPEAALDVDTPSNLP